MELNSTGRVPDLALSLADQATAHRLVSVLHHENAFLRAKVEGKGRIEADPTLRAALDRAEQQAASHKQRNEQLGQQISRLTQVRDETQDRVRMLQTQLDQLRRQRDDAVAAQRALAADVKAAQSVSTVRDEIEGRLVALESRLELGVDLDPEGQEAAQDLRRLLRRLRRPPTGPLLRMSSRYRALETRWLA